MEKLSSLLTYAVHLVLLLGSLSKELLYCHLYCNSKYLLGSLEVYLESCQISMMELFSEDSPGLEAVDCFSKKNSIMYVWECTNYASLVVSFSCIVNNVSWRCRNSRSQMFFKIGVLKTPSFDSLFNKVSGHQAFPMRFNTGVFLSNLGNF